MPYKRFSERLNNELDEMGVPQDSSERIEVFAKLLKLPRFKAEALLNGLTKPNEPLLSAIAEELEVDAEWLLGNSDDKSKSH